MSKNKKTTGVKTPVVLKERSALWFKAIGLSPFDFFIRKDANNTMAMGGVAHPLIILFSSNKKQYNHVLLIRVTRKGRYNENHQIAFGEFPPYLFGYG